MKCPASDIMYRQQQNGLLTVQPVNLTTGWNLTLPKVARLDGGMMNENPKYIIVGACYDAGGGWWQSADTNYLVALRGMTLLPIEQQLIMSRYQAGVVTPNSPNLVFDTDFWLNPDKSGANRFRSGDIAYGVAAGANMQFILATFQSFQN